MSLQGQVPWRGGRLLGPKGGVVGSSMVLDLLGVCGCGLLVVGVVGLSWVEMFGADTQCLS